MQYFVVLYHYMSYRLAILTTEINPDVIEKALSHCETNAVRSAYNRAEYLPQRRKMLKWWSDHIEKASIGSVALSRV